MKIKINNLAWNVVFTTREDINGCYGLTCFSKLEIKLAHDVHQDVVRTTITHEIIHAYIESCGFTTPNVESPMIFSEEQVCDFVAMNLEEINKLSNKLYLYYLGKYVYNKE